MSNSTIQEVPRKIIEERLLAELDDKTTVAILANEQDLDMLILVLEESNWSMRRSRYLNDLKKLKSSAFS